MSDRPQITLTLLNQDAPSEHDRQQLSGYCFRPDEKDTLLKAKDEDCAIYELWRTDIGGVYIANITKDFNPNSDVTMEGASLLAYFLTSEISLPEHGGWIRVIYSSTDELTFEENTKLDDIPNHKFLIAWLAAGNVFIPDLPDNFERWLVAIGVPLNKRIAIMNTVSLRGVDIKLFDAAADHRMQQIKDPTELRKVRRTLQHRRDRIRGLKMRK